MKFATDLTEAIITLFGGAAVIVMALLILAPLTAIVGAFSAWVVSGIFPSVTDRLCTLIGLPEAYQVGALLGFVGGFFKSTLSGKSK